MFPIRALTCLSPIARIVPIASASASASEGSAAPPMISAFNCENSRYRPFCGSSYRNAFPVVYSLRGFGRLRRLET